MTPNDRITPENQATLALPFFVSSRVTKAICRQHQADVASCEEEATYVVLTAAPESLTRDSQTGFLFHRNRWRSRSQNFQWAPLCSSLCVPRNQSMRRSY